MNSPPPPDISSIVTFHSEGPLADLMLAGFDRMRRFAEKAGLSVELVAVLDRPTPETERIVRGHPAVREADRVTKVDNGDLGSSRNDGIREAAGGFIAIHDGDDYYSENWLVEAHKAACAAEVPVAVHPEYLVTFGGIHAISKPLDMARMAGSRCPPESLMSRHPWISCVFAAKTVFTGTPYQPTRAKETGFAFEDWHWNLSIIAKGVIHTAAPATALFYRRKKVSLFTDEAKENPIIRPSPFFDSKTGLWPCDLPADSRSSTRKIADSFCRAILRPTRKAISKKHRAWWGAWIDYTFGNAMGLTPDSLRDRKSTLPDFILAEFSELAKIEPALKPTKAFRSQFHFHAPVFHPEPGCAYFRCLESLDGFQPDLLILVPWMKRGGADLGVLHHVRAASSLGKKVLVIATENAESAWAHRVREIPNAQLLDFGANAQGLKPDDRLAVLIRLLVQSSATTIHVINSDLGWQAIQNHGRCLKALGKRVYASAFAENIGDDGKPNSYPRTYLAGCLPHMDGVFCDTESHPRELQKIFGIPAEKCHAVRFPAPLSTRAFHSGTPRKILWASRLCKSKRPDLLLEIAGKCPDLHFDVHGGADDRFGKNFERLLDKLPNVTLHGAYGSIEKVVEGSDAAVFLYTSQWDGLPNVLLETTALGMPVVASAVGGVPELISDETGYPIADVDDPDAYIAQIRRALANPEERRKKWGKAALILAARHTCERFLETLRSIPNYLFPTTDIPIIHRPEQS